jgi:hypothetical protein
MAKSGEDWTCPTQLPDMSARLTGIRLRSRISPDKLRKTDSPGMSGLGAGHVRIRLLETCHICGYVRFSGKIGFEVIF